MTLESIGKNRERIVHLGVSYPWLREIEAEVAQLERNYEFLQCTYDAAIADRNANWTKLPVDADGEVIRIGDTVYNERWMDGTVVYEIGYGNFGINVYDDRGNCVYAGACRHHREPTVEDVLREFTAELLREEELYGDKHREEVTAKYAGRLREAVRAE